MRSSRLSFWGILAGILAVAGASWALAGNKARINRQFPEDLSVHRRHARPMAAERRLGGLRRRTQRLPPRLSGRGVGLPDRLRPVVGSSVGLADIFRAHYWPVFRDFIVFALPLAMFGGILGRLIGRRRNAGPALSRPLTIAWAKRARNRSAHLPPAFRTRGGGGDDGGGDDDDAGRRRWNAGRGRWKEEGLSNRGLVASKTARCRFMDYPLR